MNAESPVGPGHNSAVRKSFSAESLRAFIHRIENLEEQQAALSADKAEVYKSAKSEGWDPKLMRRVVKLRKMDPAKRQEEESLLEVYRAAVGL